MALKIKYKGIKMDDPIELLNLVVLDNYSLENTHQIDEELRDRIEAFLDALYQIEDPK